jgi:deoxycytidylate deaminase
MKRKNLGEVLAILKSSGWFDQKFANSTEADLLRSCLPLMKNTRIMNSIEFGQAVHAEMDAITGAARRIGSLANCTLYTTTFPCHNCARHIVAAGIRRVVYIEPYAKSLASRFHEDSIAVEVDATQHQVAFQPFVGIAPRIYTSLFTAPERKLKDGSGRKVTWIGTAAQPRQFPAFASYVDLEQYASDAFYVALRERDVTLSDPKTRSST